MVLKKASDQGNAALKITCKEQDVNRKELYFIKKRLFLLGQEETYRLLFSFKCDCSFVFGFWISYRMFAL